MAAGPQPLKPASLASQRASYEDWASSMPSSSDTLCCSLCRLAGPCTPLPHTPRACRIKESIPARVCLWALITCSSELPSTTDHSLWVVSSPHARWTRAVGRRKHPEETWPGGRALHRPAGLGTPCFLLPGARPTSTASPWTATGQAMGCRSTVVGAYTDAKSSWLGPHTMIYSQPSFPSTCSACVCFPSSRHSLSTLFCLPEAVYSC